MQNKDLRLLKGEEKRALILNQAIALIAQEGFRSLSAQRIATACKMSKANLFHHFQSVEAIIQAAYNAIADQISQQHFEQDLDLSLEDYIFTLGCPVFDIDARHEPVYLALMQFYQLALVEESYAERLLGLKNHVLERLKALMLQWGDAHLHKQTSNLNPEQALQHYQEALETIMDTLVMTLDAMGMYGMMHRDKALSLKQWRTQAKLYAHYLTMRMEAGRE